MSVKVKVGHGKCYEILVGRKKFLLGELVDLSNVYGFILVSVYHFIKLNIKFQFLSNWYQSCSVLEPWLLSIQHNLSYFKK